MISEFHIQQRHEDLVNGCYVDTTTNEFKALDRMRLHNAMARQLGNEYKQRQLKLHSDIKYKEKDRENNIKMNLKELGIRF